MANTIRRERKKEYDRNEERDGVQYLHRVYELKRETSLAQADLELGDSLPEDADAEIIHSKWRRDPPKGGMGSNSRLADVTAQKFMEWE